MSTRRGRRINKINAATRTAVLRRSPIGPSDISSSLKSASVAEIENIDPEMDLNSPFGKSMMNYMKAYCNAFNGDTIVLDLKSPLGSWLADNKLGQNLYDYESGVYLWACPKYVFQAIVTFGKIGGFAGISLKEYLLGIF